MNEERRARIIAYNKKIKKHKQAYDDLIKLLVPLQRVLTVLPSAVRKIIAKHQERDGNE